jgi:diguanylate cyclase (GGDEF)-like protein
MINFKNNIYTALVISFILLLSSLWLSYQNVQNSNSVLKHLSKDQSKLNLYANRLSYDIKKNQAEILQTFTLNKNYTIEKQEKAYSQIQNSIVKLQEFLKEKPSLSTKFSKRLKSVTTKTISFQAIQDSLISALKSKDLQKSEDALIAFNSLSKELNRDTELLINLANLELNQNVFELTNDKSSESLLFSFLIAVLLIGFSVYKFNLLHNRLRNQLQRAENAENDLQQIQKQLLKYNDDLEAEITKKTKELHDKIYTNSLSALPNRNKLLEDIPLYEFAYIAILNIDKFPSFNDVYGEETGNIALSMSADFLREELKNSSMFLYHIGGDEFVIVAQQNDTLSNQIFTEEIEKILKNFKTERFEYEEKHFQFMMSAGLAFGGNVRMLAHADMALKDAKKRNIQLSVFDDDKELEKTHQENIECMKKLIYALDNKNILSYYQPIVPIQDITKKTKYESLVRMRDEDGKIIPPFNFLDVAKTNRIYHKITRAVLHNTLSTIQEHHIPCSLNLSLSDIENEKTMKHLFELLDNFEQNELLTVELLETEEFTNYKLVYDFCIKVRSYGVKVALDDFGSGYSNFSHILQMPVDYIKIDATLISNIDRDLSSQIMVETIVELAHKLNVLTIAEFVSSEEIYAVVKELGVDYAQGFYLGKPLEISEYIQN